MRRSRLVVVLLAALFLAGCASVKDRIVGKWSHTEGNGPVKVETTVEFTKEGAFTLTTLLINLSGTYKVIDDNTVETETTILGAKVTGRNKIVLSGDKLTWTDDKGKTTEFTRVK